MNLKQIRNELRKAKNQNDALTYCLTSLDTDIPTNLRHDVAKAAEDYLRKDEYATAEYVANVLTAHPFPEQADLEGLLQICRTEILECLSSLIVEVKRRQPAITMVHKAWQSIPLSVFGSQEERQQFQSAAVRAGLFNIFSAEIDDTAKRGTFLVASLRSHAVLSFSFHGEVIKWWQELVEELHPSVSSVLDHQKGMARSKGAVLGGVAYTDLARLAPLAAMNSKGVNGVEDIYLNTRFLSDPLVMANKEAQAKVVSVGVAFK